MVRNATHARALARRTAAAAFAVLLGSTNSALATSYSWNVSSGDWFTATNWNPNGVPGASDDATISNGGSATVSADAQVTSFTLSNGTLTGDFTLTVSGLLSWSGGTMTGAGTTTANGGMAL